jgi:carbon monoxide dehydrogenase subunit G
MEFGGQTQIRATRQKTWQFLMDPQRVATCGPGVQGVEIIDDDNYRITAKVGIGMITSTFRLDANVAEREGTERSVIVVKGQAPGTAVEARAEMRLLDDGDEATTMDWTADVRISGKLAAMGERIIRGTAERMIKQTFECIQSRLETETDAAAAEAAAAG